ncbi:hypothetical protein T07_5574 [Trichinella nelsoni]|uniref:Uncharacterized protein n=1 Tax=Trichinella nelsoni TaxID=6336 RepID=A0A0V0RSX6_9BILA|nr:hypothetical protein T07_5574 [Trichinella nelsoni]
MAHIASNLTGKKSYSQHRLLQWIFDLPQRDLEHKKYLYSIFEYAALTDLKNSPVASLENSGNK